MSGDKLPPKPVDGCPRCGRSRLQGKRHCASPNCEWVKCPCCATYDMYSDHSYHPDDWKELP